MSAGELVGRARRTTFHLADATMFSSAPERWRAGWEPDAGQFLSGELEPRPIGFMREERGAGLRQRFPAAADALFVRAEKALAGRARFFGYPEVTVEGTRPDTDPFTGRRWPDRHAKRIDYRRSGIGDPKWIWELHRCQDLSVLAAAWLATGDERFGRAAGERLIAWIGAHPPGRGMAWSNGFEAGIRGISFALTVDALRASRFLAGDALERALRSLWQHGRWIERDPSTGSSANNHRIGELVGLLTIACLAPELQDSDRWLASTLDALAQEAAIQIRRDGTNVEQAFSYHLFVLDLFLVATSVLDAVEQNVPDEVVSAIERSGDALWAQLGDEEPAPTYGDTDDGRAFVLDADDLRDPRGVAASIAARFGHARARHVSRTLDPSAWWLFGAAGAERFQDAAPAPGPGDVALSDGGLTILRDRGRRLVLDHGPHGHTTLAAHAHADALRVDVSLGARELIVDPGVGSYFARPSFRGAFRGTGFHATVSTDGLDSSVPGGPFLWVRHAQTHILALDLERGFVVAEHSGYGRLEDPVVHRRAVLAFDDGSLLVVDRLTAVGTHRYSQRWPLHPSLELESRSPERLVARGTDAGVLMSVSSRASVTVRAARGQLEPPAGWWSDRLESIVASWHVAFDVEARGSVELATLIVPFRIDAPLSAGIALSTTTNRVSRIDVTAPHRRRIEIGMDSIPIEMRVEEATS